MYMRMKIHNLFRICLVRYMLMILIEEKITFQKRKAMSRVKDGTFNLRKWKSNSRELTEMIREDDRVKSDAPKISE